MRRHSQQHGKVRISFKMGMTWLILGLGLAGYFWFVLIGAEQIDRGQEIGQSDRSTFDPPESNVSAPGPEDDELRLTQSQVEVCVTCLEHASSVQPCLDNCPQVDSGVRDGRWSAGAFEICTSCLSLQGADGCDPLCPTDR